MCQKRRVFKIVNVYDTNTWIGNGEKTNNGSRPVIGGVWVGRRDLPSDDVTREESRTERCRLAQLEVTNRSVLDKTPWLSRAGDMR